MYTRVSRALPLSLAGHKAGIRFKIKAIVGFYQCVAAIKAAYTVVIPPGLEYLIEWMNVLEFMSLALRIMVSYSAFGFLALVTYVATSQIASSQPGWVDPGFLESASLLGSLTHSQVPPPLAAAAPSEGGHAGPSRTILPQPPLAEEGEEGGEGACGGGAGEGVRSPHFAMRAKIVSLSR